MYGSKFTAYTDNNPLTYILSSAKLDAIGQRWVAELANFDFSIAYRAGKHNIDADPLSRISQVQQDTSDVKSINFVLPEVVKAVCNSVVHAPVLINSL